MIADILRRLTAPDPDPLPFDDARLALAALLVRIARSDDDYAEIEKDRIETLLAKRYGLRISLDWLELFCVCGMHLRRFLGQAFFES